MSELELFQFVKEGGAYCAPLLFCAILWLNKDRNRLIEENKALDDKVSSLSERTIVVMTELKALFSGKTA